MCVYHVFICSAVGGHLVRFYSLAINMGQHLSLTICTFTSSPEIGNIQSMGQNQTISGFCFAVVLFCKESHLREQTCSCFIYYLVPCLCFNAERGICKRDGFPQRAFKYLLPGHLCKTFTGFCSVIIR